MSAPQRRALVTGGSKGAGAAVVADLQSRGVHATAVARRRPDDGDAVADRYIEADLSTAAGVDEIAGRIRGQGGLDVLVHVAGGSSAPAGGFATLSDQAAASVVGLDLVVDGGTLPTI